MVLEMLCPAGGWIIRGNDFDGITWVDDRLRCTEAQFQAGFAQYDAWKAEQEAQAAAKRVAAEAKLVALGLDLDDLRALGL